MRLRETTDLEIREEEKSESSWMFGWVKSKSMEYDTFLVLSWENVCREKTFPQENGGVKRNGTERRNEEKRKQEERGGCVESKESCKSGG